jgi:cytochrome bd-type quinol oxidase subunit 2
VFEESEIAGLSAKTIEALNTLTILYNSCSMVVSVLAWVVIRKHLVAGQKWAFWLLLCVIGFIEIMAFIASAGVGNARWQVNVVQSVLYVVGIGLCAYPILKPTSKVHHQITA